MGTNALFSLIARLVSWKLSSGWKTYFAATGLIGYALYLASQGEYEKAVASFLAALTAFGLRDAIATQATAAKTAALVLAVLLLSSPAAVAGDGPTHRVMPVGQAVAADAGDGPTWTIPPDERQHQIFEGDFGPLSGEWWCQIVNAPKCWERGAAGKGITVGVIDTGVQQDHPYLAGHIGLARDFTGTGAADRNSHGTHCVGVVATVAPAAKVNSYKALGDSGSGSDRAIAQAIDAAVADGCQVLSLSLGSDQPGPYSQPAVARAVARNVVVVAAAGNSGRQGIGYPGGYPGVICVAAIDSGKQVASFSSRGRRLDVAAPGVAVRSTVPGGRTASMSGTSMACPNVAGQVAVILSAKTMSAAEVRELVRSTAEDLPPDGPDTDTGAGVGRPAEALARIGIDKPQQPMPGETDEDRYRSVVEQVKAGKQVVMAVGVKFAGAVEFPTGFKSIRDGVFDCFLSNGSPSMLRRPDPTPMPARLTPFQQVAPQYAPAPVFYPQFGGGCPGGVCPTVSPSCPNGRCYR